MESAADALKLAFGIFVFLLGLVIVFNMTSQAREVSRVLVSETDRTNSYLYYDSSEYEELVDGNGNRIVTMNDIIPVLYRYSQENYGVTIVNKSGKIVARFDLDTEVICNNWDKLPNPSLTDEGEEKENFFNEFRGIFTKVNESSNKISGHTVNMGNIDTIDKLTDLFKSIYEQKTSDTVRRRYYCYWAGNMGWTAQRIDSDLSRNTGLF